MAAERAESGMLASFADPGAAARAIRALREAGVRDVRAAMPAPFPEVVEALGKPRSRLGNITFSGAVAGFCFGVFLTVGTSVAWPLVTGGKPIISVPPFVIVTFELTVLIGAIVNLLALIGTAARSARLARFPAGHEFSADRVGIFAIGGDGALAERILRGAGAEEVTRVG